jgi:hypothetical protein
MPSLPRFHKFFDPGVRYATPTNADFDRWRGKVNDKILEDWAEHGWCSYGDGFFWFVNPADFEEAIKLWVNTPATVFARTSFCHILFSDDNNNTFHLDPHRGRWTNREVKPPMYVQYGLTDDAKYVDVVLDRALHREALAKLGPIAAHEMYTFEPALALGGAAEIEYVAKAEMLPQLNILAQLTA